MNFREGGTWTQGTLKRRRNGQWVEIAGPDTGGDGPVGGGGATDGGFAWNQTFTDTSWVADAGDDLNVEKVTTLDSTGTGSISEALNNAASQPTVVVFEVGGVIDIRGSEELRVRSPEVWIAGETAPDPGIAIVGGMMRIHDPRIIVSHISLLVGDGAGDSESDGLVLDADDIMIDHCSAMWGIDECAGASNAVRRGSFINCIIAEGLYDSTHGDGQHSRGLLINDGGSDDLAIMGCLFAHNNRRHPFTRGSMVMANNYIYDFGGGEQNSGNIIVFNGSSPDITAIGLHIEPGRSSDTSLPVFQHGSSVTLYHDDIRWDHGGPLSDGSQNIVNSPPILPPGFDPNQSVVPASEVKGFVTARAGPRPARRPPVESSLINNRLDSNHGLIDSQNDVGGYPNYSMETRTLDVPNTGLLDWLQGYRHEVEIVT